MTASRDWTADNRSGITRLEKVVADIFQLSQLEQSGKQADLVDSLTGERYELKADLYAIRTGSPYFYAEFAETVDGGQNLRSSGITKQYAQCEFFILLTKRGTTYELLKVPSEKMAELLDQPWGERRTAAGRNGNSFGRYSYGKLVSWDAIRGITTDVWVLPADFDPLNPTFAASPVGPVAADREGKVHA